MITFDEAYFNMGYLDRLSYKDTFIHRIDPRAKVLSTLAFILTVVSFPKYEIAGLIPFFLFPVLFFSFGDIPVLFILKKILIVSPFALFIGIFNPFLDGRIIYVLNGIAISGGWVSFISIMLKFFLTISSALLLLATTSFPGICYALQKLGLPEIFISQLLFLYRYIFVLAEEAMRMVRARNMRSFGAKGQGVKVFMSIVGTLFLRTIERAERIYCSMLSRGFSGTMHPTKTYRFGSVDIVYLSLSAAVFYLLRSYKITAMLGSQITTIF